MQVIVKNKGLDEWLENVYLAWQAKFPERARMYRALLQQRKETLVGPTGMSKSGGLRYTAEIPQEVFWVINQKIPNFFRDPANVRKFQQYFMGDATPVRSRSKFFIDRNKEQESELPPQVPPVAVSDSQERSLEHQEVRQSPDVANAS